MGKNEHMEVLYSLLFSLNSLFGDLFMLIYLDLIFLLSAV